MGLLNIDVPSSLRSFSQLHRRGHASLAASLATTLVLGACDDDPSAPNPVARYAIEVSGEAFVVEVSTAEQIAGFEARLASGQTGVISGTLAGGDGGHNAPWAWHLVPGSVHTADAAVEVCDGRPSFVEADLDYWVDVVGTFCPWGATVAARLDE